MEINDDCVVRLQIGRTAMQLRNGKPEVTLHSPDAVLTYLMNSGIDLKNLARSEHGALIRTAIKRASVGSVRRLDEFMSSLPGVSHGKGADDDFSSLLLATQTRLSELES